MAKVLVIGVDTMIGANLALHFGEHYDCIGLYQQQAIRPAGCHTQAADLSCADAVKQAIRAARPDWIVYSGEMSRSAWDAPRDACDENELVRAIAELAAKDEIALTVISSDAACTGPGLFQEEGASVSMAAGPGVHARRVEEALRELPALVVRTHAYGWGPGALEASFAQQVAQRLRDSESVTADGVRYATPILVSDLAELLMRAHDLGLRGLYHMAGAERVNPNRFARELGLALGIEDHHARIEPGAGALPSETSLNTRRARRDLGRPMPLLREGLARFAAQAQCGYIDRLESGASLCDLQPVAA